MLFAIGRALLVWVCALAVIASTMRTAQGANLVVALLLVFYTIPVVLFLIFLHLIETKLLRSSLPVMGLAPGAFIAVIGFTVEINAISELARPIGLVWLATGVLRALRFRRPAGWS